MKPNQAIKGYKLTANTKVDILETFNAPIVLVQNQSNAPAVVTMNDGEPMHFDATPFAWEPYAPLLGTIETSSSDIVVFA